MLGRDEDEEDEDEGADGEAVTKFRYRLREDDDVVDDTDGTVLAVSAAETIIVVIFSCKCVLGACVSLSGSLRALLNARALCLLFFGVCERWIRRVDLIDDETNSQNSQT